MDLVTQFEAPAQFVEIFRYLTLSNANVHQIRLHEHSNKSTTYQRYYVKVENQTNTIVRPAIAEVPVRLLPCRSQWVGSRRGMVSTGRPSDTTYSRPQQLVVLPNADILWR